MSDNNKLDEALKANEEFNEENLALKNKLAELEKEMQEAKKEARAYKAAATRAKNTLNTKRFEAEDNQIGQDGNRSFSQDGELIQVETRKLDEDAMKTKVDTLAFMEEKVTVEIHEVTEENADHGFPVSVNGETEIFFRGQQKTVKRKFVEGLARARKTGYKCLERRTADGGIEYYYPSHTGLRFPFSVVHDPNPKGIDWLKHTLRQP